MKKGLLGIVFLLSTLSTYASISILGPLTGQTENYSYYDIDVVLEDDQYVEGFGGPATQRTYYEWIYMTPDSAGSNFTFSNYSSSLQGSDGSTTDTQVLLYDTDDFDLTNVITTAPEIFNSGIGYGWGGGQSSGEGQGTGIGAGAFNGIFDLEEKQYLVVFTSFAADALGSMDIEINGPSELYFTTVPEPSTYTLMLAFGSFLYVAIRRRHA
ncbi:MAG: hypothetical protein CMK36_05595 [Porticoccaceae bacterium]|nr:hypothetical protein [Porticoccaceae bacterium]|tara:strand:- start:18 stop:653 length:636 start_codon:yes stop_codon:yes gene_type:complete